MLVIIEPIGDKLKSSWFHKGEWIVFITSHHSSGTRR